MKGHARRASLSAGGRLLSGPERLEVFEAPASQGAERLVKLARFSGVDGQICSQESLTHEGDLASGRSRALAISAETLDRILADDRSGDLWAKIGATCEHLYCYVYEFSRQNTAAILASLADLPRAEASRLSVDRVAGPVVRYSVSDQHRTLTGHLTGLAFDSDNRFNESAFSGVSETAWAATLVTINQLPSFVKIERGRCTFFAHASALTLDLDELTDETELRHRFSQFVPQLMFLRHAFGERCWLAPNTHANFIIDDPYLRSNYGFINMDRLAESAERKRYAVTIAFIPWNHKKTASKTGRLFRAPDSRLSLCMHGCDHTGGEFGTERRDQLHTLIRSAGQRMERHERRTAIPCERVMVFPQGVFSATAMHALKECDFVAAANSQLYCEGKQPTKLSFGDLLDVAVMSYSSLPLFWRRYPSASPAEFCLDAFLNKPVLAVEHHNYFRDGYTPIESFVQTLRETCGDLNWTGLSSALMHSYVEKRSMDGTPMCRIYCRKTTIVNRQGHAQTFQISKSECEPDRIAEVQADGTRVPHRFTEECLTFELEIEGHSACSVEIVYQPVEIKAAGVAMGLSYAMRVWLRRTLSEWRDNHLCKHEGLLSAANGIRRRMIGKPLTAATPNRSGGTEPSRPCATTMTIKENSV